MRILITGGTGLLGTRFVDDALESPEHELVILSRRKRNSEHPRVKYAQWDGKSIPVGEVGEIDVLINLAGKNIGDSRWTDANKREFLQSRLDATHACTTFLREAAHQPEVFLSASAVGFYGADNPDVVDESSRPADDYLGQLCLQWEEAAMGTDVRTVLLRTGVVLDDAGGVLPQVVAPFKMGVGGVIGTGEQGFPWIHVSDWVSALWHVILGDVEGPVNLVAPEVLDNRGLTNCLKKVLRRPAFFKVPAFALKLGLGERSVLVWGGQKVVPQVLLQSGFNFRFDNAEAALRDLL